MNRNVGPIDRWIRIVISLALLAFALVGPETGYNDFGYVGVLLLGTALFDWCPLYSLFGIRTCKKKPESELKSE